MCVIFDGAWNTYWENICLSYTSVQSCLSMLAISSQCACSSGWGRAACSRQWVGFPAGDSEQTHTGQDLPLHQHRAYGGGMSCRWADTSGRGVWGLFHSCYQPFTTSNVCLWFCITLVSCHEVVTSLTEKLHICFLFQGCEQHWRIDYVLYVKTGAATIRQKKNNGQLLFC